MRPVLGAGIARDLPQMPSQAHSRAEITFADGEVLSRLSRIHLGIQRHEEIRLRLIREDVVDSPRLRETDEILRQLEKDARAAREALSTVGLRLYDGFLRHRKVPFVARVAAGLCSGCNLRLPSSFNSPSQTGLTLRRCPQCSRVLLREAA
jgi:predicted  nucleic acid-binding Zn-ribbon protein